MRTSAALGLLASLTLAALTGCAPTSVSTTTTTSAEMPSPAPRESMPSDAPAGQLVCHASTLHDGTAELYLDWNGGTAKGTLRRVAPSGAVTVQTVHAERYKGAIIADDSLSQDLVAHAATVRDHNGKPHIRLGGTGGWSACD